MDQVSEVFNKTISSDLKELSKVIKNHNTLDTQDIINELVIQKIPIVEYISKIIESGLAIRERFLLKKICLFLSEISDLSLEERVKHIEKYGKDNQELGERLLVLLEQFDDLNKSILLANLYRKLCLEDIDITTFLRLSQIINITFIEDLRCLEKLDDKHISGIEGLGLYKSGLVTRSSFDGGNFSKPNYTSPILYRVNELGLLLKKKAFK